MVEEWKDIEGFSGYHVSSLGRVSGRYVDMLVPHANEHGYLYVNLWKRNEQHQRRISRLVAQAFVPNPLGKPQANHKNGIKTDNRAENLEWMTSSENHQHSFKELGRVHGHLGKTGARYANSVPVLRLSEEGDVIAEYAGMSEAERCTGVACASISVVCRGGRLKHAGGFRWAYKEQ